MPVHILFFEGLFGLSWPALPNTVILVAAAVTAGLLVMLLIRRATQPVLRAISGFDDYASVVVVLLPLLTGLASYAHLGLAYETMLALHLLSVALLLVWLPFSKLVHVITMLPSRYVMGVKFWRRGVEV
jgi:nitrate reductase gamma subunit